MAFQFRQREIRFEQIVDRFVDLPGSLSLVQFSQPIQGLRQLLPFVRRQAPVRSRLGDRRQRLAEFLLQNVRVDNGFGQSELPGRIFGQVGAAILPQFMTRLAIFAG